MSTFTQHIIEVALKIIEYAITLPLDSSRGTALMALASMLIDYAIAWEPAPDVSVKAEELRAELKASEESLADAVKQNQSS